MYELPSRDDVKTCVITAETVKERANPTLVPHGAALREITDGPAERSA